MKYEDCKPGDVIPVKINGKVYETVISESGVQRFRSNSVLDYMFHHDSTGRELNMRDGRDIHNGMLHMDTLAVAHAQGKIDSREYMEFLMPGWSVSGFIDKFSMVKPINSWLIDNPIWDGPPSTIGHSDEDIDDFMDFAKGLVGQ